MPLAVVITGIKRLNLVKVMKNLFMARAHKKKGRPSPSE
jgi:hypothetical protein